MQTRDRERERGREREMEKEKEGEGKREGERERESARERVCVCERESAWWHVGVERRAHLHESKAYIRVERHDFLFYTCRSLFTHTPLV